jgi:hypothetical protein
MAPHGQRVLSSTRLIVVVLQLLTAAYKSTL